jgi:SAM-dependent methyltransferase
MDDQDRRLLIEWYRERLAEHGRSPAGLGCGKGGRQEVRFGVLAEPVLARPTSSVLDVGCGFADLYAFLHAHGWSGNYCGIDVSPDLLHVARELHPDLDLREAEVTAAALADASFDFVLASGTFNVRLRTGDNLAHIERALTTMRRIARVAVCVDFLSSYVDYWHPDAWHVDPAAAFAIGKRLSRRVGLRHDYMPYEFALFVYCDDAVSPRNVFEADEGAPRGEPPRLS